MRIPIGEWVSIDYELSEDGKEKMRFLISVRDKDVDIKGDIFIDKGPDGEGPAHDAPHILLGSVTLLPVP